MIEEPRSSSAADDTSKTVHSVVLDIHDDDIEFTHDFEFDDANTTDKILSVDEFFQDDEEANFEAEYPLESPENGRHAAPLSVFAGEDFDNQEQEDLENLHLGIQKY